jgi:hypothetical protein
MDGSSVGDYANSAHSWQAFTQTPEFIGNLEKIVNDAELSNDARAAAVENYILQ